MVTMTEVGVFIEEDQEILREAYKLSFSLAPGIRLMGIREEQSGEEIIDTLSTLGRCPDVVVVSNKSLRPETIEKLELIRKNYPQVGLVLLCVHYTGLGTTRLREFARRSLKGCAYLAKHSIDTFDQLAQVIHAVAQGRIMIDPGVMDGFLAEESGILPLRELTSRELDILSLMAQGHRNTAIAGVLCLEPKTVERHINHIYGKLNTSWDDSQQARVHSILMYLKATGQLLLRPVPEKETFPSQRALFPGNGAGLAAGTFPGSQRRRGGSHQAVA